MPAKESSPDRAAVVNLQSRAAHRPHGRQAWLYKGLIAAAATVQLLLVGCAKKQVSKPMPPEVQVAEVVHQDIPVYGEWVAQLTGPVNADITPKVQGYLLHQDYQNGSFVKKGQLLFDLDPRQYQAAVDQAKATMERTLANVERFQNDVTRDTPLAKQNAIPQKQLDSDIASLLAAKAQVLSDQAVLDNAHLNLAWTKVYSPIDGVAGYSNSQIGDLVGTATKMTTVSQVNPIWANFNVAESVYLANSQYLRGGKITANVPARFIQANGESYPHEGKVIQINRQIAVGTGTIQLTAQFPNPDAILRPGGFGSVQLHVGNNRNALLVPQAAVIEVQSLYQVIVVTPDSKAQFRPVKVGNRVGTNWIITDGLQPGERVVVEGIMKVQQTAAASPQLAEVGIPVRPKPQATSASGSGS